MATIIFFAAIFLIYWIVYKYYYALILSIPPLLLFYSLDNKLIATIVFWLIFIFGLINKFILPKIQKIDKARKGAYLNSAKKRFKFFFIIYIIALIIGFGASKWGYGDKESKYVYTNQIQYSNSKQLYDLIKKITNESNSKRRQLYNVLTNSEIINSDDISYNDWSTILDNKKKRTKVYNYFSSKVGLNLGTREEFENMVSNENNIYIRKNTFTSKGIKLSSPLKFHKSIKKIAHLESLYDILIVPHRESTLSEYFKYSFPELKKELSKKRITYKKAKTDIFLLFAIIPLVLYLLVEFILMLFSRLSRYQINFSDNFLFIYLKRIRYEMILKKQHNKKRIQQLEDEFKNGS